MVLDVREDAHGGWRSRRYSSTLFAIFLWSFAEPSNALILRNNPTLQTKALVRHLRVKITCVNVPGVIKTEGGVHGIEQGNAVPVALTLVLLAQLRDYHLGGESYSVRQSMHACRLQRTRTRLRANLEGSVHAGVVTDVDDILLPFVVLQLPRTDEVWFRDRLFDRSQIFLSICEAFDCGLVLVVQIVDFSHTSVLVKRS